MSFLSERKAYTRLPEGKAIKVILTDYTERELPEGTEATDRLQGFVTFKWQVIEDGRIVTDNRSFPVGTDILASEVMAQFTDKMAKDFNGIPQDELLDKLISSKAQLSMWVERKTQDNEFYTNYHFRAFIPATPVPAPGQQQQQPAINAPQQPMPFK